MRISPQTMTKTKDRDITPFIISSLTPRTLDNRFPDIKIILMTQSAQRNQKKPPEPNVI